MTEAPDPILVRLAIAGGADDTRPEVEVLDELDGLVGQLLVRAGALQREGRRGAAWQDVDRLRLEVLDGKGDPGALARALGSARKASGLAAPIALPDPAETVLALADLPEAGHVHTGLPTLDAITDGGLCGGKLHIVAGEPNVGKTSLAVQLARSAAEDGWVVGFHVADVDNREGIQLRIAQAHGVDRRAFLRHEQAALVMTAKVIRRWDGRFAIVDEAADGLTIDETAAALLAHGAKLQRRAVLFVDSLQTIALRWTSEPRTDKERIDKVVKRLVEWTRKGLTVVATCEVPRTVYAGPPKKKGQRPAPPALAAFKGSGNIEYALWTGIVLTRIRGEQDAVRAEIPKNKQGREDVTIRLVRTASRVGYDDDGEMREQGGRDDEETPAASKTPREENLEPYRERVRKALAGMPHGFAGNRENLAKLAGGKVAITRLAIATMMTTRELVQERPEGSPAVLRLRRSEEPQNAPAPVVETP